LRRNDGKLPRAVHHQKADQPAALIDHGERDLAAERLCLGDANLDHLQARFMGEPVGGNKIGHAALPPRSRSIGNDTKTVLPSAL
jgi:hypothetical protein